MDFVGTQTGVSLRASHRRDHPAIPTHPGAFDRDDADGEPPTSAVLKLFGTVENGTEPEEEFQRRVPAGKEWETLASPGRWPIAQRQYPESALWKEITGLFMGYAHSRGTPQLLMELALGRVRECPFNVEEIQTLKQNTMGAMERAGIKVERMSGDRSDLPIDFRYVDALLRAAEDPEVNLGSSTGGVRVGPGVRMPRLPALYTKKKRWRLPDQADPMACQEE